MSTTTLSSKSQIVIPARIRRRLGLAPGDRLEVEVEGDHLIIRKLPASDCERLASFRSPLWKGYAGEVERAREEWDETC